MVDLSLWQTFLYQFPIFKNRPTINEYIMLQNCKIIPSKKYIKYLNCIHKVARKGQRRTHRTHTIQHTTHITAHTILHRNTARTHYTQCTYILSQCPSINLLESDISVSEAAAVAGFGVASAYVPIAEVPATVLATEGATGGPVLYCTDINCCASVGIEIK